MIYARLKALAYNRENGYSCIGGDELHIRHEKHDPKMRIPGEHLGHVWIERSRVSARKRGDRELIHDLRNVAMLAEKQNVALPGGSGFSKERKVQARLYLISVYGREEIQKFLDLCGWEETIDQMLSICSSKE